MSYAIARREVKYRQNVTVVFDVWGYGTLTGWRLVSAAVHPRMILNFFGIQVL